MPNVPAGGLVVVVARSNIVTVRRTVPAVPLPKSSRTQSVPAAFGVRVIEPLSPIITSLEAVPPAVPPAAAPPPEPLPRQLFVRSSPWMQSLPSGTPPLPCEVPPIRSS